MGTIEFHLPDKTAPQETFHAHNCVCATDELEDVAGADGAPPPYEEVSNHEATSDITRKKHVQDEIALRITSAPSNLSAPEVLTNATEVLLPQSALYRPHPFVHTPSTTSYCVFVREATAAHVRVAYGVFLLARLFELCRRWEFCRGLLH